MAGRKVLEAIISIAGTVDPSLSKSIAQATKQTGGLGAAFKIAGAAVAAGAVAIGTAAVAGTKKLVDLGMEFDAASDAIRIGTGATGEALKALNDDFDSVYSSVPTSMEAASQAIADYNTRLGLTGPELQDLSKQALMLNNVLGVDVGSTIEASSKAFQQWGIDASDMADTMDYVFKVSQSTGMGFNELLNMSQSFGPQLQEMGFSFREATALMGQLDKAGVNTSEVMSAMKKSVTAMAKDGLGAAEGLEKYTLAISEAGSMTEATAIASEIFGSKAGSTMAAAIRDGTLSVTELTKALEESDETILKAAEDTMDFPGKLELMKQRASVALRPISETLIDQINALLPYAEQAINSFIPVLEGIGSAVGPVIERIAKIGLPLLSGAITAVGSAVESVMPFMDQGFALLDGFLSGLEGGGLMGVMGNLEDVLGVDPGTLSGMLSGVGESAAGFLTSAFQDGMQLIGPTMDLFGSLFGVVVNDIIPAIAPLTSVLFDIGTIIMDAITPVLGDVLSFVSQIITKISEAGIISDILDAIGFVLEGTLPILTDVGNALSEGIGAVLPVLADTLGVVLEILGPLFDALSPIATTLMSVLAPAVRQVADSFTLFAKLVGEALRIVVDLVKNNIDIVTQCFNGLIDFIVGTFTANWSMAWQGVSEVFGSIWQAMVGVAKSVLNAIISFINKTVIGGINGLISSASTVTEALGMGSISVRLSPIPTFEDGGFTRGLSIAGESGTEAVISFKRSEREANLSYWAKAGEMLGVDREFSGTASSGSNRPNVSVNYNPNITINGDADYSDVVRALREDRSEVRDLLLEILEERRGPVYG